MVKACFWCKVPRISLHKIPKNEGLAKKWLDYMRLGLGHGRSPNNNESFVCSAHFYPDDYITQNPSSNRHFLKPRSVPSVPFSEISDRKRTARVISNQQETSAKRNKMTEEEAAVEVIVTEEFCSEEMEDVSTEMSDEVTQGRPLETSDNETQVDDDLVDSESIEESPERKTLRDIIEKLKVEQQNLENMNKLPLTGEGPLSSVEVMSRIQSLEKRLQSWALAQFNEDVILPSTGSATIPETLQADYLLLKKENELLRIKLRNREMKIARLEKDLVNSRHALIDVKRKNEKSTDSKPAEVTLEKNSNFWEHEKKVLQAQLNSMTLVAEELRKKLMKKDVSLKKNQQQMIAAIQLLKNKYGLDTKIPSRNPSARNHT